MEYLGVGKAPEYTAKSSDRRLIGLTLLELLLVLGVLSVLLGLGALLFARLNRQVTLESASSQLSQIVLQARNEALRTGAGHRVIMDGTGAYRLEALEDDTWSLRREIDLPTRISVSTQAPDASITFDTRGYADFVPIDLSFTMSDGTRSISMVPAMSGNMRSQ